MSTFGTGIWDLILSILVMFHVTVEFIHYGHEYVTARKEKNLLNDIVDHRKISTKTKKLIQIQKDLDLIKEKIGVKEGCTDVENG